jgi:DNA-binding transcriptional MocR family regulator
MNNFDYNRAIFSSNLSTNAKITALAIAIHYNWKTKEESYPSIKTLIRETGLSKASIHRAKIELVSQGYLVSQRRFNNSNLYLPQIPGSLSLIHTQSHTEELKDNIKDNLKDNNTKSSEDSLVSSVIINLNQEEVTDTSFETIWKVFENEDGRYSDRGAAADHNTTRPRNWAAKKGSKNNRGPAKITGDFRSPGRNNYNNAELKLFNQELDRARSEEW